MIIYRLATSEHIRDLSGTGAKLYGGRWNSAGIKAIYSTENISLAILEILVHVRKYNCPADYHLLTMNIPENIKPVAISLEKLKKNWKDDSTYTQFMGDEFLKTNSSLFIKVPSAIIPAENNILINPLYKDFKKIKIKSVETFLFDVRLFKSA